MLLTKGLQSGYTPSKMSLEGIGMPKYSTMKYEPAGLRLSLSPKGWRGRLKFFIPYLSGDVMDLELHVVSNHSVTHQCEYKWQLQEFLPDRTYVVEKESDGSFMSKPARKTEVQLDTHLLQHGGEYHVIMSLAQGSNPLQSQTLLNFRVLVRDEVYINCLLGLVSGFIGAVVGALLAIFLVS